jgi:hypothetical protein
MRLLRADKLEVKSFSDLEISTCRYAILSHCWSRDAADEVLFDDIQNGSAEKRKAYPKLKGFMNQAKHDGYEWVWVDTCCIDKSSSSELSEAINSMFSWYQNAAKCYAYIEEETIFSVADLGSAKWFTRSWTLQELIGPTDLVFYDRKWIVIGSKRDKEISALVSKITSIDESILTGVSQLTTISIAKRMSWAANRIATRREDTAYSLMGIFDVNMPMLYGEGAVKAFHRLQEQIMRESNDHSIFAWRSKDGKTVAVHGLLADSPQDFAQATDIISYHDWEDASPFQLSNRGLRMELHLTELPDGTFAAALNCPVPSQARGYHGFVALKLRRLPVGINQYARVQCDALIGLTQRGPLQTVYVRQAPSVHDQDAIMPWHFFSLRSLHTAGQTFELAGAAHHVTLTPDEQHNTPPPSLASARWVAAGTISAFHVIKRARRVSAALGFCRPADNATFTLLLGCRTDLEVGFGMSLGCHIERSIQRAC